MQALHPGRITRCSDCGKRVVVNASNRLANHPPAREKNHAD